MISMILDLNAITQNEISFLRKDSQKNAQQFKKIEKVLLVDKILYFQQFRVFRTKQNIFQYQGNLTENQLYDQFKLRNRFDDFIMNCDEVRNFRLMISTLTQVQDKFYTLLFDRLYQNYKDTFLFHIQADYYDDLDFNIKSQLLERLKNVIDWISLSTKLNIEFGCKFMPNKSLNVQNTTHLDDNDQHLKKIFNLSETEMYYLQAIALSGSAKETAQVMGKSHRTVEKVIEQLRKKFDLKSKSHLQVLARIFSTYFHQENPNIKINNLQLNLAIENPVE